MLRLGLALRAWAVWTLGASFRTSELNRVLGDRYRGYRARTHRLLPGLW